VGEKKTSTNFLRKTQAGGKKKTKKKKKKKRPVHSFTPRTYWGATDLPRGGRGGKRVRREEKSGSKGRGRDKSDYTRGGSELPTKRGFNVTVRGQESSIRAKGGGVAPEVPQAH